MQIARIQRIAIDDAQRADTRAGKIREHGNAESTGSNHQYACLAKLLLADRSDIAQRDLTRVIRVLDRARLRARLRVIVRVVRSMFMCMIMRPVDVHVTMLESRSEEHTSE